MLCFCRRGVPRIRVVFAAQEFATEKSVLVGILPEVVTLEAGEQMVWVSGAGNLRVEFDPQRCPFSSNVFQAPAGTRLMSGATRPGSKPGAFKYRVFLNDQLIGHGEILYRG